MSKKNKLDQRERHDSEEKIAISPFVRNTIIAGTAVALVVCCLMCYLILRPDNKNKQFNIFDVQMISELTTLECRYHTVAVHKETDTFLGLGNRYVWLEYDVVVEIGVDLDQVKVAGPTEAGVVKIYMPPARILSSDDDSQSVTSPVHDIGLFATFTSEQERKLVAEGKQKLLNDGATQEALLVAYKNAKNTIEQYIVNVGKQLGQEYTVEWTDAPF